MSIAVGVALPPLVVVASAAIGLIGVLDEPVDDLTSSSADVVGGAVDDVDGIVEATTVDGTSDTPSDGDAGPAPDDDALPDPGPTDDDTASADPDPDPEPPHGGSSGGQAAPAPAPAAPSPQGLDSGARSDAEASDEALLRGGAANGDSDEPANDTGHGNGNDTSRQLANTEKTPAAGFGLVLVAVVVLLGRGRRVAR